MRRGRARSRRQRPASTSTPALLAALERRGIRQVSLTLHVGPGTFRPVKAENPGRARPGPPSASRSRRPTAEAVAATRRNGRRVVAVGTTVVPLSRDRGDIGWAGRRRPPDRTGLYIRPGYGFRVVDRLVTNFHLPRSTLLMLVCAFAGRNRVPRRLPPGRRERAFASIPTATRCWSTECGESAPPRRSRCRC